MVEICSLLKYNEDIRHRYFFTISSLPWEKATMSHGASWDSVRNIFVHSLGAADWWLDYLQGESKFSKKAYDDYKSIDEIREYMERVEKRMHDYIDTISDDRLKGKFTLKTDEGDTVEVTAEDILTHVFEEEIHHRGEIIALLWRMNVEPPQMGWKGL